MNIAVEISMYPFDENYKPLIKSFIEQLKTYTDLHTLTSATSTIITGDYDYVMQALKEMLAWSYAEHGRAVYVTKFIPGYSPE